MCRKLWWDAVGGNDEARRRGCLREGKERERETKLEDYREESARRKVGREFERGKSKRQEGGGCEAMTEGDGRGGRVSVHVGGRERAERSALSASASGRSSRPTSASISRSALSSSRTSVVVGLCRSAALSLSFSLSPSLFLSFPPVGTRARAPLCMCIPRSPSMSPFSPATTTSSAQWKRVELSCKQDASSTAVVCFLVSRCRGDTNSKVEEARDRACGGEERQRVAACTVPLVWVPVVVVSFPLPLSSSTLLVRRVSVNGRRSRLAHGAFRVTAVKYTRFSDHFSLYTFYANPRSVYHPDVVTFNQRALLLRNESALERARALYM